MVRANKKAESAETPESTEDKPKRKNLTAAERVAKLEADLEAARAKQAASADKRKNQLAEKREKVEEKINKLRLELAEIDRELEFVSNPATQAAALGDESTDED
jgi:hypothetical protein